MLTIPVVFGLVSDPIGSGFIQSLARPGGNATGFAYLLASLIQDAPEESYGGSRFDEGLGLQFDMSLIRPHIGRARFSRFCK